MPKILITDPLHESAIEILKEAGEVEVATGISIEEIKQKIKDADALVVRSGTNVTKEIIDASENLKVIARAGVGVDNVDLDAATEKGVVVVNAPDASSISVAELMFGMMLSAARNIPQATASIKKGEWDRKSFKGMEVYGKTLGIVGLGRIGQQVAKRAQAFGMNIVAYDPYIPENVASELGIKLLSVDDLCAASDFITLHVPLTPKTKHMIGKTQLDLMKSNTVIINCARGGLIDENALYDAINTGKIKAAGLDVFEQEPPKGSPLLSLNGIIGTPHQGASTEEAQLSAGTIVAEQTVKILKGESAENVVNLPMIPTEKMKKLMPYLVLAEKMGSMSIQYLDNSIDIIEITYMGGLAKEKTEMLKRAFLKGILSPILLAGVNLVNAPVIAKSRNIKMVEGIMAESDYGNSIKITAKGENDEISIIGSIEHNEVVFREINGYRMDIKPEGTICIIKHIDRPGMVGKVGVLLGEHGINIAGMQVGRKEPGGHSIMFLDVDHMIPEDVMDELRKIDNVRVAKAINI